MRTKFAVMGMLLSAVACGGPPSIEKRQDEQYVSLIQLIATPKEFDGRHVNVAGYLVIRDEYESSLLLSADAHQSGMLGNSIAISIDEDGAVARRAEASDRKYVVVSGRFVAEATVFSGGRLEDLYYLSPAPPGE